MYARTLRDALWLKPSIICFSLIISGCMSTDHLLLIEKAFPETPQGQKIEILMERPSRPFIEIAIVEAKGRRRTKWNELREGLREEARSIGADAVIDLKMGGQQRGGIVGTSGMESGTVVVC